jgi:hypothetical protein
LNDEIEFPMLLDMDPYLMKNNNAPSNIVADPSAVPAGSTSTPPSDSSLPDASQPPAVPPQPAEAAAAAAAAAAPESVPVHTFIFSINNL